jgi:hypothetical protein
VVGLNGPYEFPLAGFFPAFDDVRRANQEPCILPAVEAADANHTIILESQINLLVGTQSILPGMDPILFERRADHGTRFD